MHLHKTLPFLALAAQSTLAAVNGLCPIIGAVLPAPTTPASHPAVIEALQQLDKILDGEAARLNVSAFSVAVKSIHESSHMLDYHHTPSTLDPRGVQTVAGDSVYRLGSISKVFPVLAVLKLEGVSLDDRVTQYLPELRGLNDKQQVKDALTQVDWDEVTLGALASHMAGIGADYAIDYANFASYVAAATNLGLPGRESITSPGCAGIPGTAPCTKEDFFKGFGRRNPVFAPFSAPAYSNIGSPILAFVVEKVSNMTFPDFFREKVLLPLQLNNTGATKPDDSRGVIPKNDFWFGTDIGFETAAGGFYSTSDDIIAFADATLSNKILTPAATRKWLKPVTNTASLGTQLGAPWEIFRAANVTRDMRHVEVVTKSGDLFNYRTVVGMVPDYGLVYTVLVAGDVAEMGGTVPRIHAAIVKTLVPALEIASRDQARRAYAGTYRDDGTNSTLVLAVDGDDAGPGVRVDGMVVRGVDVLANWAAYSNVQGKLSTGKTAPVRLRLQPAGLTSGNREAWRGVYNVASPEDVAKRDEGFPWAENGCVTWASTDRLVYGLRALDSFVVNMGERGREGGVVAGSVEIPAFQVKLDRVV